MMVRKMMVIINNGEDDGYNDGGENDDGDN